MELFVVAVQTEYSGAVKVVIKNWRLKNMAEEIEISFGEVGGVRLYSASKSQKQLLEIAGQLIEKYFKNGKPPDGRDVA